MPLACDAGHTNQLERAPPDGETHTNSSGRACWLASNAVAWFDCGWKPLCVMERMAGGPDPLVLVAEGPTLGDFCVRPAVLDITAI